MEHHNKRGMIEEILQDGGYVDWYVVQPDKQNPDSPSAKCVLFNFVESKRAELVIPNEWFPRYHRIAKLINLAVLYATPVAAQRITDRLPCVQKQSE
jgi:hypothetical protein